MFSSLGISTGMLPERDTYSGSLTIVGSGRCVWDDLSNHTWQDVMCLNDMICYFPDEIQHVYSNDDKWLPKWMASRRPRYKLDFPRVPRAHTCQTGTSSMTIWPFPGHGTSALNAVYVGLALGYDEIILAGVPLDGSGHFFDPPNGWKNRDKFSNFDREVSGESPRYWKGAKDNVFKGRVKSLSGRTKELLNP